MVAGFECPRLGFAVKMSELTGRDFRTLDPPPTSRKLSTVGVCRAAGPSPELTQGRLAPRACAKHMAFIPQKR